MVSENAANGATGKKISWLPWAMVVLLVGMALGTCTYLLGKQNARIIRENQQLSRQVAIQGKELNHLRTALQQPTAVTYAALGKVIPVKMPAEFDVDLSAAEQAATKLARQGSPDLVEVKRNIHTVALLVRQLPPWAEQDYLPRFNALRWALSTEYLLAASGAGQNQTATEVSDNAENLIHQMNSIPNPTKLGITAATLDKLFKHLKGAARRLQSRAAELVYHSARAEALACLNNPKLDPSVAIASLQPWLNNKECGLEATLLADKLYHLVAERQAGNIMKQFNRAAKRLDGSLLTVALGNAYNGLAALKISLAARGLPADPVVEADLAKCKADLREIAQRQAAKRAKIRRYYQYWAMEQIKKCQVRYKADKKVGWNHWQYKDIMHAAINYLLPIRQGALTVAVQQEYNQEFSLVWGKLKGRDDQTYVAEQEAVVRQISPMDVWKKEYGK